MSSTYRLTDRQTEWQIDTVNRTDRQEIHRDTARLIEKKSNMEHNELRFIKLPATSYSLWFNMMCVPPLPGKRCPGFSSMKLSHRFSESATRRVHSATVTLRGLTETQKKREGKRKMSSAPGPSCLSSEWAWVNPPVLCVTFHPNTTALLTVLEAESRRGVSRYQSMAPPPIWSSYALNLTNLYPGSLFLTRLFWAFPTTVRLLRPFTPLLLSLPLFLLFFFCPFDPVSPVWALATTLWPVVRLAAITPRALVSGWGSWLGLTPFGNILVLRNTGGDVGHPCLEVVLQWWDGSQMSEWSFTGNASVCH